MFTERLHKMDSKKYPLTAACLIAAEALAMTEQSFCRSNLQNIVGTMASCVQASNAAYTA